MVGEALNTPGQQFIELPDQAAEDAHRVPEQSAVGGVVDVGFDDRGVGAKFLAVLQPESDGRLDHLLIDDFQSGWGEPDEGAVEGVMFGDRGAEELGELPQGVAIGDAFAQLAIVPVLDAHQGEGAQHLRGVESVAAGGGLFQAALEIAAHVLDQGLVLIDEVRDLLKERVEGDVLGAELKIGEAPLGRSGSGHGRISGVVALRFPRLL